jgi:hypothetical protein
MQLTFNDYLHQFSHCLNCAKALNLNIETIYKKSARPGPVKYFKPGISKFAIEFQILNTYLCNLELKINPMSHIIQFNGMNNKFEKNYYIRQFFDQYDLFADLSCKNHCQVIRTTPLNFNLDKSILDPFELSYELINLNDKFYLETSQEYSILYIRKGEETVFKEPLSYDNQLKISWSQDYLELIELPPMHLQYKSKEEILNKLSVYEFFD